MVQFGAVDGENCVHPLLNRHSDLSKRRGLLGVLELEDSYSTVFGISYHN